MSSITSWVTEASPLFWGYRDVNYEFIIIWVNGILFGTLWVK